MRKVCLYLGTFVGIKINAAVQKLLASQDFCKICRLSISCHSLVIMHTAETFDDMIFLETEINFKLQNVTVGS